jgi:elongation factor Ts
MADITASMVKELRETTGAGMMDCKKALEETKGNLAEAVDLLRVKGLAKAAKKADRVASEGVVAVATRRTGAGAAAAAVELNSETDFVARNETFQAAARQIAQAAVGVGSDVDAIRNAKVDGGQTAGELIGGLIATIGENMTLRRAARLQVDQGAVGVYVHNKAPGANDLGRIGVIVAVEGTPPVTVRRRCRSAPTSSTQRPCKRNARFRPPPPRSPASRRTWWRRWSRGASASGWRRSSS